MARRTQTLRNVCRLPSGFVSSSFHRPVTSIPRLVGACSQAGPDGTGFLSPETFQAVLHCPIWRPFPAVSRPPIVLSSPGRRHVGACLRAAGPDRLLTHTAPGRRQSSARPWRRNPDCVTVPLRCCPVGRAAYGLRASPLTRRPIARRGASRPGLTDMAQRGGDPGACSRRS